MSMQRSNYLSLLILPLLACSPTGQRAETLQQGKVSIRVDALLGLNPLDIKAAAMERLGGQRKAPVKLAFDVQLGGGIRGSLDTAGLQFRSSVERSDDWRRIMDELIVASELALGARRDLAKIRALLASESRERRIAGIALLGEADAETHKLFLQKLPHDLPPNRIREIASSLLADEGEQNTLTLIALSQRYPVLFDELLGAVAERSGQVAVAYLTAVSRGHEDEGARATARAALETRP